MLTTSSVAVPNYYSAFLCSKESWKQCAHTHYTTPNLQNCILKDVVSTPICYTSTHYLYQRNERFSKLLLKLVFTGYTVPVVQVLYHNVDWVAEDKVVAQYPQW